MTEWLLPIVLIFFVSLGISFRLRNSLIDGDFAALHYPGYFRAKGLISADTFRNELIGNPGNKTFVQYLNFYLYKILGPELSRVRQFYGLWTSAAGALLFVLIKYLTGGTIAGLLAGLTFTAWAHHPQMFAHYESAERYALLHSLLHFGCVLIALHSHYALWAVAAAILFMPMPLLHKPVYLLEAPAALLSLFVWGPQWSAVSYALTLVTVLGLLIFLFPLRKKKHIFGPLIDVQSGFYVYALGHLKNLDWGLIFKKLRHFSPRVLLRLILPAIPAFLTLSIAQEHPEILSILVFLIASMLFVLIQMRFHPYHYLPMILPLSMLLGPAWQWSTFTLSRPLLLLALLVLYGDLMVFLTLRPEILNRKIWSTAPHYLNRNEVAPDIAEILKTRTKQNEPVLVWGDTPQIYLYADRPSVYPYLEVFPGVFFDYPNKEAVFLEAIRKNPPRFIAVMMNNVNWRVLYEKTGLHYGRVDSLHCHDEWFPIYGINETEPVGWVEQGDTPDGKRLVSPPDRVIGQVYRGSSSTSDLFIECLSLRRNRKVFNPVRSKENTDPNPTAWNPEMPL